MLAGFTYFRNCAASFFLGRSEPKLDHSRPAMRNAETGARLTHHVFDPLHLDGGDLTGLPLIERKALLASRPPAQGGPGPLL
jgi:hypothetical protein